MSCHEENDEGLADMALDLARVACRLEGHPERFDACRHLRCQTARAVAVRGAPYPGPTAADLRAAGEIRGSRR